MAGWPLPRIRTQGERGVFILSSKSDANDSPCIFYSLCLLQLYSRGGGYEGEWVEGKRSGAGINFFDERKNLGKYGLLRWEGSFMNDRPHGKGQAYVAAEMEGDERWSGDTAVKGPAVEFVHGKSINFP